MNLTKAVSGAFAASILAVASPAFAEQPQTITISSRVIPQYVSGDLIGCQLGFEVARNDPEYSNGELVYLTGNIGFKAFEGKELAFTMKLGASNVSSPGVFLPPAEAFLISGYSSNKSDFVSSMPGEEGFQLFVYSAGETTFEAAVNNIIQNNEFSFSYAMKPGGLSAVVPVDLRVEQLNFDSPEHSQVSERSSQDWAACMEATLGAAIERLEEVPD